MAARKISVVPATLDLELYAGDGFVLTLTVTGADDQPLAVDGEVTSQIRDNRTSDPAETEFAVDLSEGATGKVKLALTGAQTAALIVGGKPYSGVWDVQWTPDGVEPTTILQGAISCQPDVTR